MTKKKRAPYRPGTTLARSEREGRIVDIIRMNEPYGSTAPEIKSATDISLSSVHRIVLALEKNGTLVIDRSLTPHVYRLNDANSERNQAIGQNGPIGYPDTENDLEPDVVLSVAAETLANEARRALTQAELSIDKMESLVLGEKVGMGIDPLPKDDERIRDLVKMKEVVTPSIKRSIDSLIEYVTRDSVV